MAGDWIKVEVVMPDKPEVMRMADILGLDQDTVVGKVLRFWIWVNQQTNDGHGLSVTKGAVDRLCVCTGFGAALESVGWALFQNGLLEIPNFDRHNAKTAKERALATLRKQASRANGHETVTDESRSGRDENGTRVSKREYNVGCASAPARVSKKDTNDDDDSGKDLNGHAVPATEIVTLFNELCPELKPVRVRTPKRMQAIRAFWKFVGENMDNVRAVFQRVALSDLLNGRGNPKQPGRPGYKTYFDKVIEPDLAGRIVEGQFDNHKK